MPKAFRKGSGNNWYVIIELLEQRQLLSAAIPGAGDAPLTQYDTLRTIEGSDSLPLLENAATASGLSANASGQLAALPTSLAATTISVVSSANPAVGGQSISFTATVDTSGTTIPTGTVAFVDGTNSLGTGTLNSDGVATFTDAALSVSTHSITAVYIGDSNNASSTSSVVPQTIVQASAAVGLRSSAGATSTLIDRPSHVVVVVEELRESNALGDPNMPYLNSLASDGLVYTNSHGLSTIAENGEQDYYALYSGSTQGVTDDGAGYSFTTPNLAQSLNSTPGLSFAGYSEGLPNDGSQVVMAGNSTYPDLYTRDSNPMAQFTDVGPGLTVANVSKPFSEFPTNYAQLPTVSYVIPDNLDNTLGSDFAAPYAGAPVFYQPLRSAADTWLQANIGPYLTWAKANNSLLIITAEHGDKQRNFNTGVTTIVTGAPNLFVPGIDGNYINHYNVLRTIENMYGLAPIADTASVSGLDENAQGQLSPMPAAEPITAGTSVTFTATVAPIGPGGGIPSGTVQFQIDGSNFGSPVTLVNGAAASSAISSLTAATHSVTAAYSGDANFGIDTAPALTQKVIASTVSTTTSLTSSANPAVSGQSVAFTATVAPAAPGTGMPTGRVTFLDGTTALGTGTLNGSGVATFSDPAFSVATHSITAIYAGTTNYLTSTSSALSEVVNRAATLTTLKTSVSSSVAGQSVTFTAKVAATAPGAGPPTGTVTFLDGTTSLGTATLNAAGVATLADSSLSVATHPITAVYSGSSNYLTSASSAISEVVSKAQTSTKLTASANPSVFGRSVTLTATVARVAPGAGTPTGTVTFKDGTTTVGTGTLNAAGVAMLADSQLSVAIHSITAVYSGSSNYLTSTSSAVSEVVNKAATFTRLTASADPSAFGQSVTLTATVAPVAPGAGAPTGTVTFKDGTTTVGTGKLNAAGVATLADSALSVATHSISAIYSGSSNYLTSTSSAVSEVVNKAATTTKLIVSADPSAFGQSVTVTATVAATAPESGIPTGTVTFKDGTTTLGTGTINAAGVATFTDAVLSIATHSISVAYAGNSKFLTNTSSALSEIVSKAASSTALTTSVNPSSLGRSVTFGATVVAKSPGAGKPTGTITLMDGKTKLGAGMLSVSGVATFIVGSLTTGTHSITAAYSGDLKFLASISSAIVQVIV